MSGEARRLSDNCHSPAMLLCDMSSVTSDGVDQAAAASMPSSWFLLTFRYTRPSDWLKALGIFSVKLLLEKSACKVHSANMSESSQYWHLPHVRHTPQTQSCCGSVQHNRQALKGNKPTRMHLPIMAV